MAAEPCRQTTAGGANSLNPCVCPFVACTLNGISLTSSFFWGISSFCSIITLRLLASKKMHREGGGLAHSIRCLPHQHEDSSVDLIAHIKSQAGGRCLYFCCWWDRQGGPWKLLGRLAWPTEWSFRIPENPWGLTAKAVLWSPHRHHAWYSCMYTHTPMNEHVTSMHMQVGKDTVILGSDLGRGIRVVNYTEY